MATSRHAAANINIFLRRRDGVVTAQRSGQRKASQNHFSKGGIAVTKRKYFENASTKRFFARRMC